MKTNKVLLATDLKESFTQAQGNLLHKWMITFENGDSGIVNVANGFQCKFIPGQEANYELTVTGDQFPNKVKHVQPVQQSASNQQAPSPQHNGPQQTAQQTPPPDPKTVSIEKQCCIKAAADFHKETNANRDDVLKSAKLFHSWITE